MAEQSIADPTRRFSNRVEYYVRFRPRYPAALLTFLRSLGLLPTHVVADVGSGTGFLSELFLANENKVYGVEPNDEMRTAAEASLGDDPNFISIPGTAEATTLDDHSVDVVVAGQAFHWFDAGAARAEFARILRPGGLVVLVWNDRDLSASPFSAAYEELLHGYMMEYEKVSARRVVGDDAPRIREFFAPNEMAVATFENGQTFDFEGLLGRVLSSSYAPLEGEPHELMVARLREIFDEYQQGGVVRFDYTTTAYYGWLD
jgi:SAM-dependent methyltransferase